ncbi:uncharacterized protein METZ01_LOCUS487149, partial [marine metagenome]
MLDIIINFLKSLFIKDKEEPTMEALHNISIPMDTITKVEKQEMSKFDEIIEVVLEHEGGYVNDP